MALILCVNGVCPCCLSLVSLKHSATDAFTLSLTSSAGYHLGCPRRCVIPRHVASHNFRGKGIFGGAKNNFGGGSAAAYVAMHVVK